MSIETKHAYRFGYLKSEQWQTVRIAALAREKAKCQICGHESVFNDAHHVWYPPNIWRTTEKHLVVLCRECHDFIHIVRPECKTRNEKQGLQEWQAFKLAVIAWRYSKGQVFEKAEGLGGTRNMREAIEMYRKRCSDQEKEIEILKAALSEYRISVDTKILRS